jgi:hypothetical protein
MDASCGQQSGEAAIPGQEDGELKRGIAESGRKNEDENCTSSFPSSTIPLTSGIEEAPQLLLSVIQFLPCLHFKKQVP